ncbi:MAG: ferredoxin family protein [Nitriliruptoraceae bacterium]
MSAIERHEAHPDTPTDRHNPIDINPETCIRCVICDYVCPGDIIYKTDPKSDELPVIAYPDECWYCGLCEQACPTNAITVVFHDQMLNCETPVVSLLGKRSDDQA